MKLDRPDSSGQFPLVRILPMAGNPVEENPLDLLFNYFFEKTRAPYRQIKLHVESADDLASCLEGARKMGFVNFGCTVPYKTAIVQHCSEIAERSRGIGAINLVTFEGAERRPVGHNTDGIAICNTIRQKTPIEGKRFVVLGSGGAARGIGAEIARQGAASVTVAARNPEKGEAVATMLQRFGTDGFASPFLHWRGTLVIPTETDIVLNATAAGSFPKEEELLLNWDSMDGAAMAVDVITGPRNTPFIRRAHALGLATADGVDMLVDIVHVGLGSLGIEVPRKEIDQLARELSGDPLG